MWVSLVSHGELVSSRKTLFSFVVKMTPVQHCRRVSLLLMWVSLVCGGLHGFHRFGLVASIQFGLDWRRFMGELHVATADAHYIPFRYYIIIKLNIVISSACE